MDRARGLRVLPGAAAESARFLRVDVVRVLEAPGAAAVQAAVAPETFREFPTPVVVVLSAAVAVA